VELFLPASCAGLESFEPVVPSAPPDFFSPPPDAGEPSEMPEELEPALWVLFASEETLSLRDAGFSPDPTLFDGSESGV
jgi:hypothetical protein